MARICAECGGEEFTPDTWECVTCLQTKRAEGGTPSGKDSDYDTEDWNTPGEGKGEGEFPSDAPDESPDSDGNGEGEGEGDQDQEDNLIVLIPGETISLPDGTLAVVAVSPSTFGARMPYAGRYAWILTVHLGTGKTAWRLKSVCEVERSVTTTIEAGDFIFEGAKQEIVTAPYDPHVLDGCEYTIVSLEDGTVKGLTVDEAQNVEKVKE